jgi:hypothetical protein
MDSSGRHRRGSFAPVVIRADLVDGCQPPKLVPKMVISEEFNVKIKAKALHVLLIRVFSDDVTT